MSMRKKLENSLKQLNKYKMDKFRRNFKARKILPRDL